MKGVAVAAVVAGVLCTSSNGIQLIRRDATPAVVALDVHRRHVANPVKRDQLRRRAQTVSETLDNFEVRRRFGFD